MATREELLNEVRRQFPDVSTNSQSEAFLGATRSCLGELLDLQSDDLSGSQKSKFDDHIWNFTSKVSTWMRLKKSKANMIKWKRRWFDEMISLGKPDSKEPDSKIPLVSYENASKTTQHRRKRKHADELGAAALSGSLALSLHDKGLSANAQVIRKLDKKTELGSQVLEGLKKIEKGDTNIQGNDISNCSEGSPVGKKNEDECKEGDDVEAKDRNRFQVHKMKVWHH